MSLFSPDSRELFACFLKTSRVCCTTFVRHLLAFTEILAFGGDRFETHARTSYESCWTVTKMSCDGLANTLANIFTYNFQTCFKLYRSRHMTILTTIVSKPVARNSRASEILAQDNSMSKVLMLYESSFMFCKWKKQQEYQEFCFTPAICIHTYIYNRIYI